MASCGACARCQYATMFPDSQMVGFIAFATDCARQRRSGSGSGEAEEALTTPPPPPQFSPSSPPPRSPPPISPPPPPPGWEDGAPSPPPPLIFQRPSSTPSTADSPPLVVRRRPSWRLKRPLSMRSPTSSVSPATTASPTSPRPLSFSPRPSSPPTFPPIPPSSPSRRRPLSEVFSRLQRPTPLGDDGAGDATDETRGAVMTTPDFLGAEWRRSIMVAEELPAPRGEIRFSSFRPTTPTKYEIAPVDTTDDGAEYRQRLQYASTTLLGPRLSATASAASAASPASTSSPYYSSVRQSVDLEESRDINSDFDVYSRPGVTENKLDQNVTPDESAEPLDSTVNPDETEEPVELDTSEEKFLLDLGTETEDGDEILESVYKTLEKYNVMPKINPDFLLESRVEFKPLRAPFQTHV